MQRSSLRLRHTCLAALALVVVTLAPVACARHASSVQVHGGSVDVQLPKARVTLRLVRGNVLHVHVKPDGTSSPPSLVMAPDAPTHAPAGTKVTRKGDRVTLASSSIDVTLDTKRLALTVTDPVHHQVLVRQANLARLASRKLKLRYAAGAPMYGIHGYSAKHGGTYDTPDCTTIDHDATGLLRQGIAVAKACPQGGAGGPFVWSTGGFGLLVDTRTASFDIAKGSVSVTHTSRPDLSYYVIAGRPKAIFGAVADLTGHPPLFPKWATGFTNSQWGINQKQLLDIVATYRAKHIPIDNFTLDFDWKAWGDDNYGEFRWNATKFPDGPSGKLARMLGKEGLHLTGIMKPRIFVDTVEGKYATEHHFWVPGEKASDDYFVHKPVRDIDFDIPAARRWFGEKAIAYGFDKGIVGWWNDEADEINDNTQFLNMQRALYDAQRAHTDIRVWSINRSFWLGAQRYAYGLWSGDIKSDFPTMAIQPLRMLNAITAGATLWGMDGGGFHGHPSDQNYARWIEFGAFTPIFRVHGVKPEKRQPWRYGPVAEKAATHAIRLRYRLIPYIYSYYWQGHATGVGLVRPLVFDWPHDPRTHNDVGAWMFGDWLLVSPVLKQDQTEKSIYLPEGTWTDYATGKVYPGKQTIQVATDARTWMDIPLFVRQGAIVPTQPVMDYVGQHPVTEIGVDVFPAGQATHFDYYDDNGTTYAYEHGAYYLQRLSTRRTDDGARFDIGKAKGSYTPALEAYLVKMHGIAATRVPDGGRHYASLKALSAASVPGWATGQDRFGPVTWVRVAAKGARSLHLVGATHQP